MILFRRAVLYVLLVVITVLMAHLSLEYHRYKERSRMFSKLVALHKEYQGELIRERRLLVRCHDLQRNLKGSCGKALTDMLRQLGLKQRNKYLSAMARSYNNIGPVGEW